MAAMVTHAHEQEDDALAAWLKQQESKELVRFVTIGSVDDGKSTLIGRLLHDAQGLYQDQLEAVRRASAKGSTRSAESSSEIDFSLFTDGLLAEREQGITIDVAYRYFATDRRKFIIADTPGHVQYTRNMATGASTADAAIILVDARLGVLAQTRRHAHIAALLGIPHVIACVNKMDLVSFDAERFASIGRDLEAIRVRLGIAKLRAIPVSALAGDNVVNASARTPWWTGGTLLGQLETLEPRRATDAAFRFPVQLVLRPGLSYRGFAGQIVSGSVRKGDEVMALPSGRRSRVVAVDVAGRDAGVAAVPSSIALRLADEIDVSRGDMLVHATDLPHVGASVEAHLVWMSERALDPSKTYLIKHTTRTVRATLEVVHGTDAETLNAAPATSLALNDIGFVRVHARAPLFFDAYASNRATGAFIVIDLVSNDTVAAGMIVGPAEGGPTTTSRISDEERRARLGQRGLAVSIGGRSLERARATAFEVERGLFDRGRIATVVEDSAAAEACARGGLIALIPVIDATADEGGDAILRHISAISDETV